MEIDLHNGPEVTALLREKPWKQVKHYGICCRSEGYGCATLLHLDNAHAKSATDALISLLARYVIDDEGWDETAQNELDGPILVQFILSEGYLSAAQGWEIPSDDFYTNFSGIMAGIRRGPAYQLSLNGQEIPDRTLLTKDEIVEVLCFSDVWNEYQYLLLTTSGWAFFNWGSSA